MTWGHSCPTPGLRVPFTMESNQKSLKPCSTVPPGAPPRKQHPHLRICRLGGAFKGQRLCYNSDTTSWGWAGAPFMGNSLLRKHHGLILDLPVQGQDVIIDEWALLGGEADKGCRPRASTCPGGLTPSLGAARVGGSSGLLNRWEKPCLTCLGPGTQQVLKRH